MIASAQERPNGARRPLGLPFNEELEASVLAGVMNHEGALGDMPSLEIDDFHALRHRVVFEAIRNLEAAGRPIGVVALEVEIERQGKLDAVGGVAFLGELALRCPTVDNVVLYAADLRTLARNRGLVIELASALDRAKGWPHDPSELVGEVLGQLERFAETDRVRRPANATPWRRGPDLAAEVARAAGEPWSSLRLGPDELVRARAGAIVVVMGGSGSGKSSLVSCLLLEHAKNHGPAIAMSIELPADELAARIVGIRCDAAWEDALRGRVEQRFVVDALNLPRLYVLDRAGATLRNLRDAIRAARIAHPGEPIVVAIDYAQLIRGDAHEMRQRVSDTFERIDALARSERVVAIAVSQMGRAQARSAREGERIGADAADLGAESAAIERFSTITLTIGKAGEPREDGSRAVELSVGKARMGEGDRVVPTSYWGKSGLWRVAGEAKSADAVREGRETEKAEKIERTTELSLLGALGKSMHPLSRTQLIEIAGVNKKKGLSTIARLVNEGSFVELARCAPRSKSWLVWTPEKAASSGEKLRSEADQ